MGGGLLPEILHTYRINNKRKEKRLLILLLRIGILDGLEGVKMKKTFINSAYLVLFRHMIVTGIKQL